MMLWKPFKFAGSMYTPNFLCIDQLGMSSNQFNTKPSGSFFILGKVHGYWAYMHRILSCPAAENLLIAVRGVSYPHVTQLVGGIYAQSTWIIVIFMQQNNSISFSCFSIREKLYMNHLKFNIVNRSGRISFCMNRYFEVTLTWSKWC